MLYDRFKEIMKHMMWALIVILGMEEEIEGLGVGVLVG